MFFSVLATTSSIRAGWIRPSCTKRCRDSLAISLRTGSNPEMMIASGVSSTTISTPVAASSARIFRPSRPMILPLISSLSMLKMDTQFSTACSVAVRCMVSNTIFLACLVAVNLASSRMSFIMEEAFVCASSVSMLTSSSRASSLLSAAIFSKSAIRWLVTRSSSAFFT